MNFIKMHREIGNIKRAKQFLIGFLIVEVCLYFSFLLLDLFNVYVDISNILKYISIMGCLFFVFFSFLKDKEKSTLFMLVILIFTVIADTFLLFSELIGIGVVSFIVVQLLYSHKIKKSCKDNCKVYMMEILTIIFLWNVLILLLKNEQFLTPTIVVASLYFILFTGNMIRIWIQVIKGENVTKQQTVLAIGLTLFYLCDINVGLNFLQSYDTQGLGVLKILIENAGILMWLFYLPSQAILTVNSVIHSKL